MRSGIKARNKLLELPLKGLGDKVIESLKSEKSKDAAWQGKSSGAV